MLDLPVGPAEDTPETLAARLRRAQGLAGDPASDVPGGASPAGPSADVVPGAPEVGPVQSLPTI